jgi:phosphate transport system substrate-binding protein
LQGADRDNTVRVCGEDASINGFLLPVKDSFEEENGGVKLDIVWSRPGSELAQLLRGEVDAVISAHSLEQLLRAAADEQVPIDSSRLQSMEVGRNSTVVMLNRKNAIAKLTKKQLKGILTGRITNWKQLHGADRAIVVVCNKSPTADDDAFIRGILGEERLAAQLQPVYSYEAVRKLVAATPEAIGVIPSVYASSNVAVPDAPKISSPVIVVTNGAPSRQVTRLTQILKEMELLQ